MSEILAGPWEFLVGDYVRQESTGIVICDIRKLGIPEYEAHGKLIAAAPCLLEACQAAMRLDYFREHNALADQMRAAIARATT